MVCRGIHVDDDDADDGDDGDGDCDMDGWHGRTCSLLNRLGEGVWRMVRQNSLFVHICVQASFVEGQPPNPQNTTHGFGDFISHAGRSSRGAPIFKAHAHIV